MSLRFDPARRAEDMAYTLTAYGERATHLEPVLWDIVDKMMVAEMRIFETRGASSGRYWSPLRGSTVHIKTKLGVPNVMDPLIRYGDLRQSLTQMGAQYQVLRVDDDELEFGTDHPAAEYHTYGTKHMPARPPLIVTKRAAAEYIQDIKDFVFGGGDYA